MWGYPGRIVSRGNNNSEILNLKLDTMGTRKGDSVYFVYNAVN